MTEHEEIVLFSKALQDENRLQILEMLQSGEKCACKLLENLCIEQSTLSHHMKILCKCGLVHWKKVGKWMHYSINNEGTKRAMILFQKLTHVLNPLQPTSSPTKSFTTCGCEKQERPLL
ncbi:MAG: metalloregulator ArsR/SmtB family transcription factor [Caldisericia bacterium]|nr:metalloregulator ArsR/SmtB family transcription factor [Caldisericia bacterium]MDD4614873.1 metalloregulator ArsR/SmtB family transcription factor [Caldisericia bacterium]